MSLVEDLRVVCEGEGESTGLGWKFSYGNKDFQNLTQDTEEGSIQFFLDPVERQPVFTPSGGKTNETIYNGRFMILTRSKLSEVYDGQGEGGADEGKWRKHIKPKIDLLESTIEKAIQCKGAYSIENWRVIDVVNVFQENWDGILINFRISHDNS